MIPPKIFIKGNHRQAVIFLGYAKKSLADLQRDMAFNKLNEGHVTLHLAPGVTINIWVSFSIKQIEIIVAPVVGGYDLEKIKLEKRVFCPCFPCLAFGIIENIRTIPTDDEYKDGVRFAYDIFVCRGTSYLFLENYEVLTTGWEEYYVGQYVLVTIDVLDTVDTLPLCCSDKRCLFIDPLNEDKVVPDCFTVSPLFVQGFMQRWIEV